MKLIMLSFVIFICFTLNAGASSLKIAIGLALPPYIISDENRGMEYDIVEAVLNSRGYEIEPYYFPFARIVKSMRDKLVDGVMTINEQSGLENVYYTNSHITYQNVAISLASEQLRIDSISDLADYSIIAFQNAKLYLGDEYRQTVENNPKYRELAQQDNQVALFFIGRTQVYLGDINIFHYYRATLDNVDTTAEITVHPIFPKTYYKVAFHDRQLRDEFNTGLEALKKSGEYNRIIEKYSRNLDQQ